MALGDVLGNAPDHHGGEEQRER
ncbi:MAG: hypothetical protein JWP75_1226, partial [Frondihabitans sp.]|nr:hypothetical protein [Frondihabitans sp.]